MYCQTSVFLEYIVLKEKEGFLYWPELFPFDFHFFLGGLVGLLIQNFQILPDSPLELGKCTCFWSKCYKVMK